MVKNKGTGATAPAAAKSSDGGGERSGSKKNGVGMGQRDATGSNGCYDTGKTSGTCYSHVKGYKGKG